MKKKTKKNKSRPHNKIPVGAFITALENAGGIQSVAAQALGISRQAVSQRINRSAKLKKLVTDIVESELDLCENEMRKARTAGNIAANIHFLECKGKHRGWFKTLNQALSNPDGSPLIPQKEHTKIADGMAVEEAMRIYMEQLK